MIAIIPERVIGMPRNTDRHRPESPVALKAHSRWTQTPNLISCESQLRASESLSAAASFSRFSQSYSPQFPVLGDLRLGDFEFRVAGMTNRHICTTNPQIRCAPRKTNLRLS